MIHNTIELSMCVLFCFFVFIDLLDSDTPIMSTILCSY